MRFGNLRAIIWCVVCGATCAISQASAAEVMPESLAAQHGFARPWFTQADMDPDKSQLRDLVLFDGTLYVHSSHGSIMAIDGETGASLWSQRVGNPKYPSMELAVGDDFVAVISGLDLYILNRYNGKMLTKKRIDGSPGAGPAVGFQYAYVPMTQGMVVAYRLKKSYDDELTTDLADNSLSADQKTALEKRRRAGLRLSDESFPELSIQSKGRTLVQPLVTQNDEVEEHLAWSTDQGFLYMARLNLTSKQQFELQYRLPTPRPINFRPTYIPADPRNISESGKVIAASSAGYVYAVAERDGTDLWRFPTGETPAQSAIGIDDYVYTAVHTTGLHCISSKDGKLIWSTPEANKFVSAGKNRVYATDRAGRLLTLDAATGARLDSLPTEKYPIKYANAENDRIYVATESGFIMCLHETELKSPVLHNQARIDAEIAAAPDKKDAGKKSNKPAADDKTKKPGDNPAKEETKKAEEADPFAN